MSPVNGKVILITGAARGIGAEVARRLLAKGAKLVLLDVDEAPLDQLAKELGSADVMTAIADVRAISAMQKAVDDAVARFGGIDVVLANAGIASYGSVMQVDPDAFKRVIDVNVVGAFNTVRAALPSVIDRRGYVLVVSSLAAYAASPGLVPYNTAKAGNEHFANALRLELAPLGVDVGSAHMSWINTQMIKESQADLSTFKELLSTNPGPISKTTSVDKCADAFVKGIEGRKRRVNCPRWVGAFRWLRPLLSSRFGEAQMIKSTPDGLLARMDAEVAALGRSTSARNEALEQQLGRRD
jgi:NAD(P)-dependent dehydrogenase (short-subunit alcohol dehydrogenase family)